MPIYLQPVSLPERCFLYEVLLWVAFQRLPIAFYDSYGWEIHDLEDGEFSPDIAHTEITDEECRRAGIPPDPSYAALLDDTLLPDPSYFDGILEKMQLDADERAEVLKRRDAARTFHADYLRWRQHYDRAVEYPASQIFVALRSGALQAHGRLIVKDDVGSENVGAVVSIPAAFWSLKAINFENSEAQSDSEQYQHISVLTADVLNQFPGHRSPVSGVQRVGDSFVLDESVEVRRLSHARGRPAYPWEAFHLEVAALLRAGALPEKKEAAIQHFQTWFDRELKVRPSRAAIGERLKPYYEKFVRRIGQKSGS